jgi:hypothetical protein
MEYEKINLILESAWKACFTVAAILIILFILFNIKSNGQQKTICTLPGTADR